MIISGNKPLVGDSVGHRLDGLFKMNCLFCVRPPTPLHKYKYTVSGTLKENAQHLNVSYAPIPHRPRIPRIATN